MKPVKRRNDFLSSVKLNLQNLPFYVKNEISNLPRKCDIRIVTIYDKDKRVKSPSHLCSLEGPYGRETDKKKRKEI